ncbi:PIN domain-containing protein [Aliinostoc sp. HNIBRCY26]|uniref:PIN domain-containing protein n=1 Tax=Aliinostoc sp. HNIBRCY26 TaxID=3418997 RepID=UPI003D033170
MGIAQGQDLAAIELLNKTPNSLRILIPNICFLEALNTLEKEKKDRYEFKQELNKQINKSKRNIASINAQNAVFHLEQTLILNQATLNEINYRLYDAIDKLIDKAEIINLNSYVLRNIIEQNFIEPETLHIKNDILDNLILNCILNHADLNNQCEKIFMSSNTNDFGKQEVQELLQRSGIRYFSRTQDFLGWWQSQNN